MRFLKKLDSKSMKYNDTLKISVVAAAITSVMMVPATAQAIEFKISGQVSRMVVFPDDAAGDEIQHVDIGWSGSRFRFTGSETADNGISYGFRYEIQARENSAGAHNGGQLSDTGDNQDNRYQDLYFSGDFGKISLGKGDGAANGATEVDLSGTALSSSSNHQDNWGGYQIAPGVRWSSVFTMYDGLSRQNRVRYDTPSFSGVSIAGSLDQGNAYELALRYKGDVGDTKIGLAVFGAKSADRDEDTDGDDIFGGSASVLLGMGLNLTVAYSERDFDEVGGDTADALTGKIGYKTGMHAFSVDYGTSENSGGQEGETIGVTYSLSPYKGVEIFGTYRELDSDKVDDSQSVDLFAVGSRIKF
jgi:predicted porin